MHATLTRIVPGSRVSGSYQLTSAHHTLDDARCPIRCGGGGVLAPSYATRKRRVYVVSGACQFAFASKCKLRFSARFLFSFLLFWWRWCCACACASLAYMLRMTERGTTTVVENFARTAEEIYLTRAHLIHGATRTRGSSWSRPI